jgi:hypothetical protein
MANVASVMEPIHTDFRGDQTTLPATGSVPADATMRSDPGTRCEGGDADGWSWISHALCIARAL